MKSKVVIPVVGYPVNKDIVLNFEEEEWNNHSLRDAIYEMLKRFDSEEMSSSKAGTSQFFAISEAIRDGKFSKRELEMFGITIGSIKFQTNHLLNTIEEYIKIELKNE